jgi:membrane-bound serine protease (ClpP class)
VRFIRASACSSARPASTGLGWRGRATFAVALLLALCGRTTLVTHAQTSASTPAPQVIELTIDGEIDPVLAEYIDQGIDRANATHAALVLITMDTPGGLDTAMREIVQHMLDSTVPVAVYVTPTGSRGASAGFFILLAADIAAMTPGTHTGAASPILAIGGYPVSMDDTLKSKILNDATAYLRSYAGHRGRNVELAETAITGAKAFTEQEAIDGHLIDLVAASRDELLASLDGRTITRFDGRSTRLALAHPAIVRIDMTARQRFLSRIVQPDVFFILLLVGVLGLYVEFTHPGLILPGVAGAVSLLLALFAMHILPVSLTGLLLLGLATALFIFEAHYTSHGVLAVGGIVAMLLGALMLIQSPLTGAGVSLGVALGATLPFAGITVLLMRLVLRSRAWAPQTGIEQLVHETGEVTEPVGAGAPDAFGLVFVRGELWRAAAAQPIARGTRVRIVRIDGLTLHVEPVDEPSAI